MAERISPTLRRRRLAARLRQLREQAGLKVEEVARLVEWTPSKVVWIEGNRGKRPNPRDVRDLCEAYRVTDDRERAHLEQLARDGRLKGWWDPYGDVLPHSYENYVGLEAEAATMLNFELGMIPGLLQTDAYAHAMIQAGPAELSADKIDKRVEVRMKRQAALRQDPALRLVAVIDEAALHRKVGGPEVMRAQLRHLIEAAEELPRATIQVVPFAGGAHPSMTNGFVILQFPEPEDPDVVYVENAAGGLWLEETQEVTDHHVAFQHLLGSADSALDTIALIAKIAKS
jgi:transcriptional regulator with XRE-family HTH domain